jgi:two-component system nitrogen regulation response regulator NtrX
MLTGPSGCGKEVAARYVHSESDRALGPFISVNSASIEAENMEKVLFGTEKPDGSYDTGLLEEANGGILFFDEVADMPIGTQSKILRVLVDQQFTRVGGASKVRVNIRVISATNRNLKDEIANGNFREELYHRLNVVPIQVPSLESRREDIPMLATYFIEQANLIQGLPLRELAEEASALLQTMDWPGNVRQLRNVIERILILGKETGPIGADEMPITEGEPKEEGANGLNPQFATMPLREAREMFEREYLLTQINRFGGNISRTANFIGMERSALHRKLKSLNIVTTNKSGARLAEIEAETA